jgi:hypothetical protein
VEGFREVEVPTLGGSTTEGLEACMRKSVAHEEVGTWPGVGRRGENVTGEPSDDAGREERSEVRSNGDWEIGGAGDTLWLAEKKFAASSAKPDTAACAVRNACRWHMRC